MSLYHLPSRRPKFLPPRRGFRPSLESLEQRHFCEAAGGCAGIGVVVLGDCSGLPDGQFGLQGGDAPREQFGIDGHART